MSINLTTLIDFAEIAAPGLSVAGRATVYPDSTSHTFKTSLNGGAYDDIVLAGLAQTLSLKTLVTPTIASFSNAAHDHSNAAGGGQLTNSALTSGVYSAITGLGAQSQVLDMNTQRITNLGAPAATTDAATKAYVDSTAQGLDPKGSVRAATTANITLSGTQTIDGVAVVANDRVLVKNQTAPAENGIYVAAVGAWTRSTDADAWGELVSAFVFVEEGTTNADSGFTCTVDQGGTLGVTAVTWTQFSGAGTYTAGNGLSLVGSEFSINYGYAGTWTATQTFSNANPIVSAKIGPVSGTQMHTIPAVANDTFTLNDAAQTLTNKTLTTPTIASFTNATHNHQAAAGGGILDHGLALAGSLLDDDHTQYALLAGRAGGQSLTGGTGASENLVLASTSNVTKGDIQIASGSDLDIVSGTLQIGTTIVFEADRDVAITLLPNADNSLNLGSEARRWALVRATTVTTGDLNLRSEDSDWTIMEQPETIHAINRKTGKRYELMLREIQ